MILTSFGKEFIIINEELAIYLSFLIVLTILVSQFGEQLSNLFSEETTKLAETTSLTSQTKVNFLSKQLMLFYKTSNFLNYLSKFETAEIYKLLKLKDQVIKLLVISEFKLI